MALILTNVIQGMTLNNIQEVSADILGNANALVYYNIRTYNSKST